jgi:hypothetical protein
MKRTLATIIGLAAVTLLSPRLKAADHRDSPTLAADPATDINDVFVWAQDDTPASEAPPTKINLAMTVYRDAADTQMFSTAAQYVFHVTKHPGYGMAPAGALAVLCNFAPNGRGQCWLGPEAGGTPVDYVGDIEPNVAEGTTSASGMMKVFIGRRNDPFFFNLDGFNAAVTAVTGAAGSLTFNAQGCPAVPMVTAATLRGQLGTAPGGGAAQDSFAGENVLAIVVQVDKALISDQTNKVVGVWASTNMP